MDAKQTRALDNMVAELRQAAGDALVSVILHGAEARGDHYEAAHDLYLLIVLEDLKPATLRLLREPVGKWLKKGNPMPRLFTVSTIEASADSFPIELLDISNHKKVLHGSDPFGDIQVDMQHLRLQCERELREKLMRVQEAYVESRGRQRDLERLLIDSYLAFLDIFRGCLRLLASEVPARAGDIVSSLCKEADLDPAPFLSIDKLAQGGSVTVDLDELFASYYQQLVKAVHVVDRFGGQTQ